MTNNFKQPKYKIKNKQQGFTLVEILLVISLIAFIGTLAVTNLMGQYNQGKRKGTVVIMKQLQTALDDYYRTCNSYPTTAQGGLDALITKPTVGQECRNYDPSGFLKDKRVPRDGWDKEFLYVNEDGSNKYTLKSLGGDGKEGGEGNDRDLDVNDPNL